ncbi:MAG: DEAD/DEAH box helicase, partial [Ignavibacteriae bacterium]|nr:DEAD/DEAH box helicase [Ignavibacteriota bacterium]
MAVREYIRICKQAGCGQEFLISASSLDADRTIGFSEPEYCPKHRSLHARSYSRIACHHYDVKMTRMGEELARRIERQKKFETQKAEELSGKLFDPWWLPEAGFGPGGLGRFQRPLRAFLENTNYLPEQKAFQIAEKKDEILTALEEHQVVVLVGTTGSGKSTYVPWLLLTGGVPGGLSKWARRGPICVTQPRIQATRQVPRFIANKLNGTSLGIGSQIGFSHSKADEYDRRTRLIFKTDGKLINDIVSGAVSEFSIVIIDEAHERSVNIDLILGLLRDQLYLYPHLRIIIASATIDFGSFIGFFHPELKPHLVAFEDEEFLKKYSYFNEEGKIPFIYSEGRRFPITEHFWGDAKDEWWKKINGGQQPSRDQFPNAIAEMVQQLCKHLDDLPANRKDEDGHILVFLPGSREIDQTVSAIEACGLPNVVALPLYAQRPLDEQEAALNPDPKKHHKVYGKRRVVVSTNVAETSLTVEGVRYVIDTGYIKESYWNPATEVSELRTVRHSRAGCRQRWGRAGRISSGHAFMLYTKNQFDDIFPNDSAPAIARSSLEQVLLTAKAAGVRTAKGPRASKSLDFHWMPLSNPEDDKRLKEELIRAYVSLQRQGILDKDGD